MNRPCLGIGVLLQRDVVHIGNGALVPSDQMDNGLERIAYSRKRMSYMPNIYVVGQDGFQRFCQVFYTMSYEMLGRLEGRGDL